MSSRILTLDAQGQPHRWISREDAITYHAKNLVAFQIGEDAGELVKTSDGAEVWVPAVVTFRGGENRETGNLTTIQTAPIIAVKGKATAAKRMYKVPSLTNRELFRRDRNICAYCVKSFSDIKLTRDHVIPRSRGGADVWTNVVTACERCNHKKDDMLVEECGMTPAYVPYTPNRAEALILENRNILTCQMDYLKSFLDKDSRVWIDIRAAEALKAA
jgi:hypothetical protein